VLIFGQIFGLTFAAKTAYETHLVISVFQIAGNPGKLSMRTHCRFHGRAPSRIVMVQSPFGMFTVCLQLIMCLQLPTPPPYTHASDSTLMILCLLQTTEDHNLSRFHMISTAGGRTGYGTRKCCCCSGSCCGTMLAARSVSPGL
jgi:hypothetical protein